MSGERQRTERDDLAEQLLDLADTYDADNLAEPTLLRKAASRLRSASPEAGVEPPAETLRDIEPSLIIRICAVAEAYGISTNNDVAIQDAQRLRDLAREPAPSNEGEEGTRVDPEDLKRLKTILLPALRGENGGHGLTLAHAQAESEPLARILAALSGEGES